jgi:tripartite-type tricarboxylate transporter receptor subunit TctC
MRNTVVAVVFGAVLAIVTPAGTAQTAYPNKPVKLIVPFAPGGFTDVMARILGQKLSLALGQQIVVENKPGAGSTIGTDFVAKAAPDGYTLLMVSSTHVISPWIYRNLPYDPLKSFAPVSKLADSPYVLLVNPRCRRRTCRSSSRSRKRSPNQITTRRPATAARSI